MKRTLALSFLAVLVPLTLALRGATHRQDEPETELAKRMEIVKDALRSLRRSLRDPAENDASLATIAACQEAVVFCKSQVPAMTARVPEEKRGEFVRDFRLEMIHLMRGFLALEEAIVAGKDAAAVQEAFDAVRALEDPAHERFTEDG